MEKYSLVQYSRTHTDRLQSRTTGSVNSDRTAVGTPRLLWGPGAHEGLETPFPLGHMLIDGGLGPRGQSTLTRPPLGHPDSRGEHGTHEGLVTLSLAVMTYGAGQL